MLSTSIPLLEKFGISWSILPYFGNADRSFLLLSQLSVKSREMLNSHYEAILNWLIETAAILKINNKDRAKMLFLPWNLFRFSINLSNESCADSFIKLLKWIDNQEGYHFNDKFMHSRLCIDKLEAGANFAEILYPLLELLKKTAIINCIKDKNNKIVLTRSTLIDKISLKIGRFKLSNKYLGTVFSFLMNFSSDIKTNPDLVLLSLISISHSKLLQLKQ